MKFVCKKKSPDCRLSSYLYRSILCMGIMAEVMTPAPNWPKTGKGYSQSCYKLNKTNAPFTPKSSYVGRGFTDLRSFDLWVCLWIDGLLGSLSNNDGDGCENVASKVKSRYFQLYRAYSISFSLSNVGKFFWNWIQIECIEDQEKKKKVVLWSCPKSEIMHFHLAVVGKSVMRVAVLPI